MEEIMKERFFAASNSSKGFCSYYDGVFDPGKLSRIYVIKGGSGTGKAYFMKEVAKCAELNGFSVRYIYCSSDSESLDGIIINELKIAVLDGTAPHVYEPRYIGAAESFVNLADFLDERMLSSSRRIIEHTIQKKQRCFERAYHGLRAYHELSDIMQDLIYPAVKLEKMKAFAKRFVDGIETGSGQEEHALMRSIGMRGLSEFDTYFEFSKIYYEINDYFETAHLMMWEIYSVVKEKKEDLRISNNPIISTRLDAICLKNSGLTFEIGNRMDEGMRLINMKRFVDSDAVAQIRQEYRNVARVRDLVLELVLSEFENIKKHHFLLEEIYGSAMNFAAKEQFTSEFCKKIFENN
jgi:hypothetical protein